MDSREKKPLFMEIIGQAGSGKSVLIRQLVKMLRSKTNVAAYTGKAALNVSGETVHALLNLMPGNKDLEST